MFVSQKRDWKIKIKLYNTFVMGIWIKFIRITLIGYSGFQGMMDKDNPRDM